MLVIHASLHVELLVVVRNDISKSHFGGLIPLSPRRLCMCIVAERFPPRLYIDRKSCMAFSNCFRAYSTDETASIYASCGSDNADRVGYQRPTESRWHEIISGSLAQYGGASAR